MDEANNVPEQRRTKIEQSFAAQGMMQTFGARLVGLGIGNAVIEAPIRDATSQQHGYAHAALTFGIGDSAAGYAALSLFDDDTEIVTSEIGIHLLAPATGEKLLAEGGVVRAGRRQIVVRSDVFVLTGKQKTCVAIMTGTMVPVPARRD